MNSFIEDKMQFKMEGCYICKKENIINYVECDMCKTKSCKTCARKIANKHFKGRTLDKIIDYIDGGPKPDHITRSRIKKIIENKKLCPGC